MVSLAQFGEMGHVGAPRHILVRHGFHDFSIEHPYFDPERHGGPVVPWHTTARSTIPLRTDTAMNVLFCTCVFHRDAFLSVLWPRARFQENKLV